MAKQTNPRIGLRVPIPIRERWQEQADQEHRTLSNWIIHKIESVTPGSEEHPRSRKKSATG